MLGFWIIVCHLIGDYVTQSDWMANNKTKADAPALVHATIYSLPFFLLGATWKAYMVIMVTHYFIDRYRLARYVAYAKNWIAPPSQIPQYANLATVKFGADRTGEWMNRNSITTATGSNLILWKRMPWDACKTTGYTPDTPPFMAVWLMIIADNTLHLLIAGLALVYL